MYDSIRLKLAHSVPGSLAFKDERISLLFGLVLMWHMPATGKGSVSCSRILTGRAHSVRGTFSCFYGFICINKELGKDQSFASAGCFRGMHSVPGNCSAEATGGERSTKPLLVVQFSERISLCLNSRPNWIVGLMNVQFYTCFLL